jgi:hypothetical protein
LEFVKQYNPQLTPTVTEMILDELFTELVTEFYINYHIGPFTKTHLVDLDSSTSIKFSRHWILHLPNNMLFTNARHVGIFVKRFVTRLENECKSGELKARGHELLADNLLVYADDDADDNDDNDNDDNDNGEEKEKKLLLRRKTHFIDLGVYTRNRIFRLLGSTKFGKPSTATLRIADANQFPFPCGFDNSKFYKPEMMMMNNPPIVDVVNNSNEAVEVRDDDDDDNDDVTTIDVSSYTKTNVLSLYICHAIISLLINNRVLVLLEPRRMTMLILKHFAIPSVGRPTLMPWLQLLSFLLTQ